MFHWSCSRLEDLCNKEFSKRSYVFCLALFCEFNRNGISYSFWLHRRSRTVTASLNFAILNTQGFISSLKASFLRPNVCNFRESVDNRDFLRDEMCRVVSHVGTLKQASHQCRHTKVFANLVSFTRGTKREALKIFWKTLFNLIVIKKN